MHLWRIYETETSLTSGKVNGGGETGVGGRIFTEYPFVPLEAATMRLYYLFKKR